jgi:glucosamine--fructose-6-phosphate aminotransferase (isomerizing)
MCGIIGYTGHRQASEVVLESLRRLEYRGYDSAGVAILGPGVRMHKRKGDLEAMRSTLPQLRGTVGIGHTRWATCGRPSDENAHPFQDCRGRLAIVHNGIIENYRALKDGLLQRGHIFTSQTDTEVIAHLLEENYEGDLREAMARTVRELQGTYAIVAVAEGSPAMVAARKENPLVVGLGAGETLIASDVTALLAYTNKVLYVHDGEIVVATPQGAAIYGPDGEERRRAPEAVTWTAEDAQKGGFEHYMLKEIFEQPQAAHNSLLNALDMVEGDLLPKADFSAIKMVACGTSFHAAMVGKYVIEELARVPVTLELASEYRYSPGAKENPLVILVTQSGETADTLAAAREARRRGCRTLAITNVVGSSITREADEVLYTRAGPEIGVAATKTHLTQLLAMYLIAIRLGYATRVMGYDAMWSALAALRRTPALVQEVLDDTSAIEAAAGSLAKAEHAFYIGRGMNYPTVLEGALKLKEISYVHAEGFAAGELKHGPLALLDERTPVVAVAVAGDATYEKMLSNISEVMARDAPVICVGLAGDAELDRAADRVIRIPRVAPIFSPLPTTIALQLLAYHAARARGCAIDKPRNLAKSVTVE